MLAYLHGLDVILWIAVAVTQLVLALLLHRRRTNERYPTFLLFVDFSAITTILLMAISSVNINTYYWSYYVCSIAACILIGAALGEIYFKIFGPSDSLPEWVPQTIFAWLAGAVASCALSTFLLRSLRPGKYLALMSGIQAGLVSALLMSIIILVLYSRWLGISWRPWPVRIIAGFTLFLTVNAITMFVIGRVSNPSALIASRCGQVAYLFSLFWWGCSLYAKEPVPETATKEQTMVMMRHHLQTMEALAHTTGE